MQTTFAMQPLMSMPAKAASAVVNPMQANTPAHHKFSGAGSMNAERSAEPGRATPHLTAELLQAQFMYRAGWQSLNQVEPPVRLPADPVSASKPGLQFESLNLKA